MFAIQLSEETNLCEVRDLGEQPNQLVSFGRVAVLLSQGLNLVDLLTNQPLAITMLPKIGFAVT